MAVSANMFHSRIHIEAGDMVILYMSRDNMTAITITPGEVFHNKFGRYAHDDLIGVKFGSKVHSPPPHAGYIYVLRPTAELWTLSLPHRTQILYMADIAYIIARLGVRVGGRVIEAGTGSGSMTHSLARAVGPRGLVRSYEYHRPRYEKAGVEFESHGLTQVKLEHRNVCKDGFGDATDIEGVFLDLPAPWEAIPEAKRVMRQDSLAKICCFSPCLEQVLKTATALRAEGFAEISTQEVLIRTHELVPPAPSSSSHMKSITDVVKDLKQHQKRKEDRRIVQMRTAREKSARIKAEQRAAAEAAEGTSETTVPAVADGAEEDGAPAKKRKLDTEPAYPSAAKPKQIRGAVAADAQDAVDEPSPEDEEGDVAAAWDEPVSHMATTVLTKPAPEMRGHTSYLTFATLYPLRIREQLAEQAEARTGTGTPVPTGGAARVAQLAKEDSQTAINTRETSVGAETEYGSEGFGEAMGTLTEEELFMLQAQP